jgi:hypothetical protein
MTNTPLNHPNPKYQRQNVSAGYYAKRKKKKKDIDSNLDNYLEDHSIFVSPAGQC